MSHRHEILVITIIKVGTSYYNHVGQHGRRAHRVWPPRRRDGCEADPRDLQTGTFCHNYIGHNYMGHSYIGHTYIYRQAHFAITI